MSSILIRADAGPTIGYGHLMRCLALAQAWQKEVDGTAGFMMQDPDQSIKEQITAEGFEVIPLPPGIDAALDAQYVCSIADSHESRWVIVDGYRFDYDYQCLLKRCGQKVLFIDDFGHAGSYAADLVLNQNVYANDSYYQIKNDYTRLLLGPRFALLRKSFLARKGWIRNIPPHARKILISLGGSDPKNATSLVLDAFERIMMPGMILKVVITAKNSCISTIRSRLISAPYEGDLLIDTRDMPDLMAWADLAISAGGSTNLEMAFMGLPGLTINLFGNQVLNSDFLQRDGLIENLGWYEKVNVQDMADRIFQLMESEERRTSMSVKGRSLVDGNGASRVVQYMRSDYSA